MSEQRGAWRRFGERTVHDSPWVQLGLADVESPSGDRFEHYVVHMRRVAVALAVNQADEVLMLWRYRFATDQWGYEMPGVLSRRARRRLPRPRGRPPRSAGTRR